MTNQFFDRQSFLQKITTLPDEIAHQLSPVLPQDEHFMAMAIEYAKKGCYITRPNPSVGCVIEKNLEIVGVGTTDKVGGFHAEVFALQMAGDKAFGATAYVTLEPCSHTGRTPPCADALIKAGVARVVIANIDPNPRVSGQGVAKLLKAGITITVGVLANQAFEVNVGFLKAMAIGLPYVRVKLATSLDGRVAMASGESKWITGEIARQDVQRLRARSGAIITGSQTIIADNPALTVRGQDGRISVENSLNTIIDVKDIPQPKIVVMDRSERLNDASSYQVFDRPDTIIWRDDLVTLLTTLVKDHQCYDVLVESGATLATAFLQSGLVDELVVYQAPCLLGETAKTMFTAHFEKLAQSLTMTCVDVKLLGKDIKSTFVFG